MRYTWACLKKAPFVALPLLVLALFGKGTLGESSDHMIGGLVFIFVGMFVCGVVFDLIRGAGLIVRWLHRAAAGE